MISNTHYPFQVPELPYAYDALEPYIDRETMHFHHDKHFKTYVDNLNAALKNYPQYHDWTLTELLSRLDQLPEELQTPVQNNGGGVYNHDLYFDMMAPAGQEISPIIARAFGGQENWENKMKSVALGQFGSGFAWLVLDRDKNLRVIALPNQNNPLSLGLYPILPLDVWEHAYYLKYQNLRNSYVDSWFHVINWEQVEKRLLEQL